VRHAPLIHHSVTFNLICAMLLQVVLSRNSRRYPSRPSPPTPPPSPSLLTLLSRSADAVMDHGDTNLTLVAENQKKGNILCRTAKRIVEASVAAQTMGLVKAPPTPRVLLLGFFFDRLQGEANSLLVFLDSDSFDTLLSQSRAYDNYKHLVEYMVAAFESLKLYSGEHLRDAARTQSRPARIAFLLKTAIFLLREDEFRTRARTTLRSPDVRAFHQLLQRKESERMEEIQRERAASAAQFAYLGAGEGGGARARERERGKGGGAREEEEDDADEGGRGRGRWHGPSKRGGDSGGGGAGGGGGARAAVRAAVRAAGGGGAEEEEEDDADEGGRGRGRWHGPSERGGDSGGGGAGGGGAHSGAHGGARGWGAGGSGCGCGGGRSRGVSEAAGDRSRGSGGGGRGVSEAAGDRSRGSGGGGRGVSVAAGDRGRGSGGGGGGSEGGSVVDLTSPRRLGRSPGRSPRRSPRRSNPRRALFVLGDSAIGGGGGGGGARADAEEEEEGAEGCGPWGGRVSGLGRDERGGDSGGGGAGDGGAHSGARGWGAGRGRGVSEAAGDRSRGSGGGGRGVSVAADDRGRGSGGGGGGGVGDSVVDLTSPRRLGRSPGRSPRRSPRRSGSSARGGDGGGSIVYLTDSDSARSGDGGGARREGGAGSKRSREPMRGGASGACSDCKPMRGSASGDSAAASKRICVPESTRRLMQTCAMCTGNKFPFQTTVRRSTPLVTPPIARYVLPNNSPCPPQHQRKDALSCPFNRHGNTYSEWKKLEDRDKLCRHPGCEQVKPNCVCCNECAKPRSLHGSRTARAAFSLFAFTKCERPSRRPKAMEMAMRLRYGLRLNSFRMRAWEAYSRHIPAMATAASSGSARVSTPVRAFMKLGATTSAAARRPRCRAWLSTLLLPKVSPAAMSTCQPHMKWSRRLGQAYANAEKSCGAQSESRPVAEMSRPNSFCTAPRSS
jgi:hypothetical protein